MIRSLFSAILLALPFSGLASEVEPVAQLTACVQKQAAAGGDVSDCIESAHRKCLQYSPDTAPEAAVKCFLDHKKLWGDAVTDQIDDLKADIDEQRYEIVRINTRYDLTTHLLQCDRLTELAQLQGMPGPKVQAQQSRCEATAAGLTFIKLLLQVKASE